MSKLEDMQAAVGIAQDFWTANAAAIAGPVAPNAGGILRTAASIVDGPRNDTHGDKERSFNTIAAYWAAYLESRGCRVNITGADVAQMMVLLKIARASHGKPAADHFVDAAGYAAIAGELFKAV